jgi:CRISPR/Cas system CMR-associated protein Cmr3 (group 5 of RAMP superfamily)
MMTTKKSKNKIKINKSKINNKAVLMTLHLATKAGINNKILNLKSQRNCSKNKTPTRFLKYNTNNNKKQKFIQRRQSGISKRRLITFLQLSCDSHNNRKSAKTFH